MEGKKVDAILSDYDGTLCPTTSLRDKNSYDSGGTIPQVLEQILFRISEHIPVCIISSKDFIFLHKRADLLIFYPVFLEQKQLFTSLITEMKLRTMIASDARF
jgi:hypothetical protein